MKIFTIIKLYLKGYRKFPNKQPRIGSSVMIASYSKLLGWTYYEHKVIGTSHIDAVNGNIGFSNKDGILFAPFNIYWKYVFCVVNVRVYNKDKGQEFCMNKEIN